MIRCGLVYSLILFEDGTLYGCGNNEFGQLGLKDNEDRLTFQKVPFDKKIIQISAGLAHTLVLTEDFQVHSCGWNLRSGLGLDDEIDRKELEWISSLKEKRIIQVECGFEHACALTDDGFVYSWGSNSCGQLGHGDIGNRKIPTLIDGLTNIKKIICGTYVSMAINENDELYVWGHNISGQLGLGDFTNRLKPTLNSFFKNKKIIKMAYGYDHCLALLENGEVYSWGRNRCGQLGHGDIENKNTPTLISSFKGMNVIDVFAIFEQSFILFENGKAICLNDKNKSSLEHEMLTFFQNEKIVNIEGGGDNTFIILDDGKIYGVGSNKYGQLGIGFTEKTLVPQLISFNEK